MRRILIQIVAGVIAILAIAYGGDYLSLRFRVPGHREQFGNVTVKLTYAIHEKNGRTEYQFPPPEQQACVQSLFPHYGYPPCWYLNRHTTQTVEI